MATVAPLAAKEDDGVEFGLVPLLGEGVEIDDDSAAVVIIFPLEEGSGGVVDPDEEREDAYEQARRIFFRQPHNYPHEPGESGLECLEVLKKDEVSEGEYQEVVRNCFLNILQRGGFLAASSQSIDMDEVFLRISIASNRERFMLLAENSRYNMPIRETAYRKAGEHAKVLTNDRGALVPAYCEYELELDDDFEDFRQVDEIRLIMRYLLARVSLEEMKKQGVITTYFPAARYDDVIVLDEVWARISNALNWATDEDIERVRSYFGEKIAFFFAWFGTYNRYLSSLTVAAGFTSIRMLTFIPYDYRQWIEDAFAVFVVVWMASFNELFKRKGSRLKQLWGMDDWDLEQATTRSDYRHELEGTRNGAFLKFAASTCVVLYIVLFATLIIGISVIDKEMRDNGDLRLKKWSPYIVSVLMKVCSYAWSKSAYTVVSWENHRTDTRFDNALAWTLASVKLFVALFPFASLAFLENYINETCAHSLEHAAVKVYKHVGWPRGTELYQEDHRERGCTSCPLIEIPPVAMNATLDLGFLDTYHRMNSKGKHCVNGCYPTYCWTEILGGENVLVCDTNCWENLSTQLVTFYLLQLASAAFFLLVPIGITKYKVTMELAKVSGGGGEATLRTKLRTALRIFCNCFALCSRQPPKSHVHPPGDAAAYSFIQLQAKCNDAAPYEYGSWGGSYVEDFLELAIGYSLLACFAQVVPYMTIIGLLSMMVLYRILAYRMVNVTSRPWPDGAEGIGTWQHILETICTLAVTCNVGLATFVMRPMRTRSSEVKFLFFILAEKVLFTLQTFADFMLKDEPDDVIRIKDYNQALVKELTHQSLAYATETYDYKGVDIRASTDMESHSQVLRPARSRSLRQMGASKRQIFTRRCS